MIHTTDRPLFKTCRKQYEYKVVKRLSPKARKNEIEIGNAGHEALAIYYKNNLFTQPVFSFEDIVSDLDYEVDKDDLTLLLDSYHLKYYETDKDIKVLHVEEQFKYVPDKNKEDEGISSTGDLVFIKNGQTCLRDHKFYKKLKDNMLMGIDDQLSTYIANLNWNGIKIQFAELNQICTNVPVIPEKGVRGKLLKSGITTTPELIDMACRIHNLNPDDYADWKLSCANEVFLRHVTFRSRKQIEEHLEQMTYDIAEMKNPRYYRNTGYHCRYCDYFQICNTEYEGGSPIEIIDEGFYIRPDGIR